MAPGQFPQEDTDDYLQEFQKAQAKQYTPWEYALAGQRAPPDEARGSALLYSLKAAGLGESHTKKSRKPQGRARAA